MNACIYARTCRREKQHNTVKIEHQVEAARAIALRHNALIEPEHIFMDIERSGALMPTCWTAEGAESRTALSVMIEALQSGEFSAVIVHQVDALGTSSEVLTALADLFKSCGAQLLASPEQLARTDDPTAAFALSILRPCIRVETEVEQEKLALQKARKLEEIQRLKARLARLESEL
jgi:DNA invertase Pin-like site-specific DNA recombinase